MVREASPRPSTCAILLTAFMQIRMGQVVVMGLTMKARISQREPKMDIEKRNGNSFLWPVTAIAAVTALEKASHDALSSDFQKHNQKLHQLLFNLKSTALLALRFLKGKLEPSKILDMSPNELNEGLTAEETAKEESDESEQMQMTDARCSRCNECKVGLRDIIQAGLGDRYQLECIAVVIPGMHPEMKRLP